MKKENPWEFAYKSSAFAILGFVLIFVISVITYPHDNVSGLGGLLNMLVILLAGIIGILMIIISFIVSFVRAKVPKNYLYPENSAPSRVKNISKTVIFTLIIIVTVSIALVYYISTDWVGQRKEYIETMPESSTNIYNLEGADPNFKSQPLK